MSPDVEHSRATDVVDTTSAPGPVAPEAGVAAPAEPPSVRAATAEAVEDAEERVERESAAFHGAHPDHQILRKAGTDRWKWRAKIRQSPTQLRIYRAVVGVVGFFFICLGFVSGPIPGPGGIPLVLLGLAIWSSEFVWAQRLMAWFKRQLRRFQSWTRPQQALAWIAFFACCGMFGYAYLLVLGPPGWLPLPAESMLAKLPGV